MKKTTLFFMALFTLHAFGQNFQPNVIFENDPNSLLSPDISLTADIDGDGDKDLIVGAWIDKNLVIYINNGTGNFGNPQEIYAGENIPMAETGDIDGDGDLDIVFSTVYTATGDHLLWLENTGNLTFVEHTVYDFGVHIYPRDLEVGDIDGDGDLDIAAVTLWNDSVLWYDNTDGLGTFGNENVVASDLDFPYHIDLGDIDGDNDLDILSLSVNDDKIVWYENTDGTGTFGTEIVIHPEANGVKVAEFADMDGDGDLDVVYGQAQSTNYVAQTAWAENDALSFTNYHFIGDKKPFLLKTADMNNDGNKDVVIITYDSVYYYEMSAGGTQAAEQTLFSQGSFGLWHFDVGDIYGNTRPDIIFANQTFNMVGVISNTNAGFSAPLRITPNAYMPTTLAYDDLTQDGNKELISGFENQGKIAYFTAIPQTNTEVVINNENASILKVTDANNDNVPDIIYSSNENLYYLQNSGDGINYTPFTIDNYGDVWNYALTDFNSDGFLDVVTKGMAYMIFYAGDGQGNFTFTYFIDNYSAGIPDFYTPQQPPLVADFDNTGGFKQVFQYFTQPNFIRYYTFNATTQQYEFASTVDDFTGTDMYFMDYVANDYDNDNDMDVISLVYDANSTSYFLRIYENDGQGNFTPNNITALTLTANQIKLVDMDGDGDQDLLTNKISWVENDNGNFTTEHDVYAATEFASDMLATDYNNDGLIDVFTTYKYKGKIMYFQQTTTGFVSYAINDKISIYPNPVQASVFVKGLESVLQSVKIVDLNGQQISPLHVNTQTNQIDLPDLNTGIYLMYITDQKGNKYVKKIVCP